MKTVCKDLTEYVMNITNFERPEMSPLTEKEKSYFKQKLSICCKSKFNTDFKIYWKVWDHNHYTGNCKSAVGVHIYNLKTETKFPYFYTMDRTIIIKELAVELEGQSECLGENTEKHTPFSVPIEEKLENGKKWHIEKNLLTA